MHRCSGSVVLLAYARHALATAYPVIDLRLFRLSDVPRRACSVGSLFRIGIQSTPFLLPLLLQLGFGLDPLRSGLLTCATAVGAMFVKTLAVMILRRFGFRPVLIVNGSLCALDRRHVRSVRGAATPHAVIVALLLLSRLPALAAVHRAAGAHVRRHRRRDMSQAASISSMVQRLSQSMGDRHGGVSAQLSSTVQGHATIVRGRFRARVHRASRLVALVAPLLHRRLARDAGDAVSGHVRT